MTRVDAALASGLAMLTLSICLYFAPRGHHLGFVDMAQDGYQLRQAIDLSRGGLIFRDTFDQYGPLNGYVNTAAFMLLGRRLLAIKYFLAICYAAIAVVLFVTARRWLSTTEAAFAILLWLALAPFYQHGIMISPHVYVLLLQAIAVLVVLTPVPSSGRFALAGVLSGLSWGMKESIGVLFLAGVLAFLVLHAVTRRDSRAASMHGAVALCAGFVVVVGAVLVWLWAAGGLHDWYLQTIAFPRSFYLESYARSPGASRLLLPVREFLMLQWQAASYWWVVRIVVIAGGIVSLRRGGSSELTLMACVTALLWLGAYPSAHFMHQWWTTSLAFAPFVVCIAQAVRRLIARPALRIAATMVIAIAIVPIGLAERVRAVRARQLALTDTLTEPAMFRGIRTTAPVKKVFDAMDRRMRAYRSAHARARVVSVEASIFPASLVFLEFFEDNDHPHPVYWSEPVLTDVTYPGYLPALWKDVEAGHPLIVDHRIGRLQLQNIAGYSPLVVAASDYGYWYLYGRNEAGPLPPLIMLDGDGNETVVAAGDVVALAKSAAQPNNWNIHGGFRENRVVALEAGTAAERADVYTWPSDLPVQLLPPQGAFLPVSDTPFTRAASVSAIGPGMWTVRGRADDRYSYVLQFPAVPAAKGSYFLARGEVKEGGLSVGLTRKGAWYGVVNVIQPGPFLIALQVQDAGSYEVVVANCLDSPLSSALGLVSNALLRNEFTVTRAGWITTDGTEGPVR